MFGIMFSGAYPLSRRTSDVGHRGKDEGGGRERGFVSAAPRQSASGDMVMNRGGALWTLYACRAQDTNAHRTPVLGTPVLFHRSSAWLSAHRQNVIAAQGIDRGPNILAPHIVGVVEIYLCAFLRSGTTHTRCTHIVGDPRAPPRARAHAPLVGDIDPPVALPREHYRVLRRVGQPGEG